jgi:hypothetical protein
MTTFTYDRLTCERCEGSGNYSNGRCFKCYGRGTWFTAAAKRSHAIMQAKREELCSVLASDMKAGDVVRAYDNKLRTVVSVTPQTHAAKADGVEFFMLDVVYANNVGEVVFPNQRFFTAPTVEQLAVLVALSKTLKGVTVKESN